jgi:hypothetical protein
MRHGAALQTGASATTAPPPAGTCASSKEVPNVDLRENQAVLALLAAIPANRLAAAALAELLSRRRSCERACVALVHWAREA